MKQSFRVSEHQAGIPERSWRNPTRKVEIPKLKAEEVEVDVDVVLDREKLRFLLKPNSTGYMGRTGGWICHIYRRRHTSLDHEDGCRCESCMYGA